MQLVYSAQYIIYSASCNILYIILLCCCMHLYIHSRGMHALHVNIYILYIITDVNEILYNNY